MPGVKRGESRNNYVSRCVKEVIKEGKGQKAAVGKCEGMFDSKWQGPKKGSKKK